MFLVAGLGNPGEQYAATPHNLGFLAVDLLGEQEGIRVTRTDSKSLIGLGTLGNQAVMLAKPQTFMNLSGTALRPLMEKHAVSPQQLILVYDELDLPWGHLRIRPKGSAGGHHGVESVIKQLGTDEFTRIRLGIHPGHPVKSGADYVLAPFNRQQGKELDVVLSFAANAVRSIIADGVEKSMTKFNRRAEGLTIEEQ